MLHELLLALSGHYGEVFALHPPPPQQPETFKIPVNFPIYLHISERQALEELAHLGFLYLQISNFVKEKLEYTDKYNIKAIPKLEDRSVSYPSLDNISSLVEENRNRTSRKTKPVEYSLKDFQNGYYIRALCSGINQILDKYLDRIAMAERKILDNLDPETIGPSTPISFLKYYFSEYKVILPYLYQLTINIKDSPHKYHGTLLLSKLYNCANNGIPEIKKTFLFLFKVCNFVFYKQLISWVIFGKLEDRNNEFFIRLNENKKKNIGRNNYSRLNTPLWYSEYELVDDYIPVYIKKDIAKTILFIGKSVAAIYDPRNQKKRLSNFSLESQLNELSKLSQYNSFNHYKFETVIRNIKHIVSNVLWKVVVIDENLIFYLEVFKNFFLLGKGDYFVKFIEECEILKARANIRSALITEQDLNNLWNRIAINTTAENDETLENFSFKVYHKTSELEDFIYRSPYDDFLFGFPIRLEYYIKWPLDLIFTQSDFDKYNTLFSFLIVLKRVQMRLQHLLTRTYTNRHTRHQTFEHQNHIWSIRQMMLFFINCLWSYIQMDVFWINYEELIQSISNEKQKITPENLNSTSNININLNSSKIPATANPPSIITTTSSPSTQDKENNNNINNTTNDNNDNNNNNNNNNEDDATEHQNLEDIQIYHKKYLDNLLKGCFLEHGIFNAIGKCIRTVILLCDQFCLVVEKGLDSKSISEETWNTCKDLGLQFQENTFFLFRTFSGVKTAAVSSWQNKYLSQLLLRMDFNHWFSINGLNQNGSSMWLTSNNEFLNTTTATANNNNNNEVDDNK